MDNIQKSYGYIKNPTTVPKHNELGNVVNQFYNNVHQYILIVIIKNILCSLKEWGQIILWVQNWSHIMSHCCSTITKLVINCKVCFHCSVHTIQPLLCMCV